MTASASEPLLDAGAGKTETLEKSPRRRWCRYSSHELSLMGVFFCCKFVNGLAFQSIRVYAPFWARDLRLSFPEYRLGLLAVDLSAIAPCFLSLDSVPPRVLSAGCILISAIAIVLPQLLPPGEPWPVAVTICRFFFGLAAWLFASISGAVMTCIAEERRTQAIALVEISWFLASFASPIFGAMFDAVGATFTVTALILVPSIALAWASLRFLPASPSGVAAGGAVEALSVPAPTDRFAQATALHRRLAGVLIWCFVTALCTSIFTCRYGAWLHDDFEMSAANVGVISSAIGVGNLAGNVLTQIAGDRFLSPRAMMLAMTLLLVGWNAALALSPAGMPVAALFAAIAIFYLAVECAYLTSISYTMQLLGGFQGLSGMSLRFAYGSMGTAVADWLAPYPSMPTLFALSAVGFLASAAVLQAFQAVAAGGSWGAAAAEDQRQQA